MSMVLARIQLNSNATVKLSATTTTANNIIIVDQPLLTLVGLISDELLTMLSRHVLTTGKTLR